MRTMTEQDTTIALQEIIFDIFKQLVTNLDTVLKLTIIEKAYGFEIKADWIDTTLLEKREITPEKY